MKKRTGHYVTHCGQCHRRLKDPLDAPLYVVVPDKYFCDAACWNKFRRRAAKE